MGLIFTIVVAILNFVVAIIEWITIERKIKLQCMVMISKKKSKSDKKKRTTLRHQAKR